MLQDNAHSVERLAGNAVGVITLFCKRQVPEDSTSLLEPMLRTCFGCCADTEEDKMLSRGDLVQVEGIAHYTNDEMKAFINALSSDARRGERLVYHFTSKRTAGFILEGHGLRASTVGQLGGGLSVCKASPHEMGWEQYGGPTWREGVGKKLWGEKWENVLMGHEDADKLEVVIVAKIPEVLFNDTSCARSLLFRTCIFFPIDLAHTKKAFPLLQPHSVAYAHQNNACPIPH